MKMERIPLADQYPGLGGSGAVLTAYLQDSIPLTKLSLPTIARPAVVIVPGGAYHFVSAREAEPVVWYFMAMGFQCFVLNYSTAPDHGYPQSLRELTAAVDMVWKNAPQWYIDREKLILCGFSAGGHLAASYCTLANLPENRAVVEPHPVAAAVLGYPVITADPAFCHEDSMVHLAGGQTPAQAQRELFSLEKHVCAGWTPPTFLWHSAGDQTVSAKNSLCYASALMDAQIPCELHLFPGGRHGESTCDRQVEVRNNTHLRSAHQWLTLAKRWLTDVLDLEKDPDI